MSDNMKLWDEVTKTNPADTKKVTFGRGFTAIDPYSQIRRATEVFGQAGKEWGWEVVQIVPLDAIAEIGVLVRLDVGDKMVEQFGQAGLYIDKANTKKDSDCLKKATTDGLTKCLSYLGFNYDVFSGKFDDNKYVAQMNAEFKEKISPEPIDMKKVGNYVKVFKELIDQDHVEETHDRIKVGWKQLSNDERIAVTEQLTEKAPDSNKMYKSLLKEHTDYKEAR